MITKSLLKKDLESTKYTIIRLFIFGFIFLAILIGGLYFIV
jgi:hypothetical protein